MILNSNKASAFALKCDYCGAAFTRRKSDVLKSRKIIEKDSCGSKTCTSKKRIESNLKKYGCENPSQNKEVKNKQENTLFKKYGVKVPSKNKKIIDKMKSTNVERYGTSCSLHSKEIKAKTIETWKKNYGCDHPFGSPEIREKINNSMQIKYGDHFTRTKEYREKTKNTCIKKYGKEHHLMCDNVQEKRKKTNIKKYGKEYPSQNENIIEKILSSKKGKLIKYGKTQKEIKNYLEQISRSEFKTHQILNREIDIFSAKMGIAIEYCGLYWHNERSPSPRNKEYHYLKYDMCKNKNIRLLTIFEDEWVNKQSQCKAFLASALGVFERKVHGRKCEIKNIIKKEANLFYSDFHIQGPPNNTIIAFGIYHREELLGCISISNHHRIKGQVVISRLCFKKGVQIIGGASKFFKHCKKWCINNNINKIITWSDNRWSEGNVYKKNGFSMEEELKPDYSYVNLNKRCERVSKQSMKKSNNNCPKEITEKQWAENNGFVRIWDCGKKRWVLNF